MQNLNKFALKYEGSGEVVLYGDETVATYDKNENLYRTSIKFSIGSKGYDVSGKVWVITGISASSNKETIYKAKIGNVTKYFRDSEILVNQARKSCIPPKIDDIPPDKLSVNHRKTTFRS